ncbi:MAG: prolyl oligopeptidase family serine peptidase [Kiritimatiellae bacterium]|nr:prolyl oligopeptidase family serine peptidase [Kiritimatiellia bacterium]
MKRISTIALAATSAISAMAASIQDRTEARQFTGSNGTNFLYRWAEKVPADGSKVPLVLFFHGAGERGDNNVSQLHHGVADIVAWLDANEAGFKFVAGQVPTGKRWVEVDWGAAAHTMPVEPSETMGLALELLDTLLADPTVDTNRVYATGISMGGYGTWDIICRRPEVFAAALPICGGADLAQAPRIASMPIWTFHGSKDTSVPVSRSRSMMSALWAAGSDAHYWEHPDAPHNVWTRTYQNGEVLTWFFAQTKSASSGGESGGDTPIVGPTETDLGDVRLESESFALAAQTSGATRKTASSFTIAPGSGKGGLDRIVATGGSGYANAHLDIGEFRREGNAVLDIHAPNNVLGTAAIGTAGTDNITCSNGVATIGTGVAGTSSVPVVPWARGAISSITNDAVWTQLVTYGDNGFRFLDAQTEYETVASAQTGVVPTSGANVRVTAAGVVDFAGDCNVNSFSMLSTAAATVYATNGTVRISSGVLDLSSTADNATFKGSVDFGEATGYISYYAAKKAALEGSVAGRDVVIGDNLLDASAGKGLLTVRATGAFSGDLYVNGSVTIAEKTFVPGGTRTGNLHVNGKIFVDEPTINGLFGGGIVDKPYTGTKTFTIGGNDAGGDFGGTIQNTKGNFNMTKIGAGTQRFGGSVTIGGDFSVNGGTVLLEGTLSAKSVSVANGASLVVNLPASLAASEEPVRVVTTTSAMTLSSFTKGERVLSLELRENGTELWATGKPLFTVVSLQ